METIKSYTDLSQSKKLAEILPLESADGYWFKGFPAQPYMIYTKGTPNPGEHISCWSLAALLSVLPRIEHLKPFIDLSPELDSDKVAIYYHSEDSPYIVRDNLIDACYEMILKLHEFKML